MNVPSRMRYEIQGFLMQQYSECYLERSCLSSWHSATTAFTVERGEMPRLSMRMGNWVPPKKEILLVEEDF